MTIKQGRFLTGSTMRHVVVMTMTASVGLTFMFLIDAASLFWVSQMGVEQNVAALGFAWTIQFFTISAGIGLMIAAVALVSRSIGQGDRALARRQATASMVIAGGVQGVIALIIWLSRDPILASAGASGETLQIASRYLAISLPALPIVAVGMVGSAVLRAEGDAYRSMMVMIIAGLVAMVLDPLFIFTFGLGVDGAAYVVVISRLVTAVLSVWFIIRVHDLAAKPAWADIQIIAKPFFLIATPAILTQLSTPFGNYIVTIFMSGYGDGAVAGWAVVSRLTVVAFGGVFALSGAVGGIFGQNYGAGKMDRVVSTYRNSLVYCIIYVAAAWLVLFLMRDVIVDVFGLGAQGAEIVYSFTNLAAGGFAFSGILFVSNAAFNNLGHPLWSTGFNWARDGILILPLCWVFGGMLAGPGVVYGQALAAVIVGSLAAVVAWRFVNELGK